LPWIRGAHVDPAVLRDGAAGDPPEPTPDDAEWHFKHPDQAMAITVSSNDGKEVAPSTCNAILKKAGLK
jgi:hypothetical protein